MAMLRTRRLAFGMALAAAQQLPYRAAGTVYSVPSSRIAIVRDARFYNAIGPEEGVASLIAYSPDWSSYVTFGALVLAHAAAGSWLGDVVLAEGEHLVINWTVGTELQYLVTGAELVVP